MPRKRRPPMPDGQALYAGLRRPILDRLADALAAIGIWSPRIDLTSLYYDEDHGEWMSVDTIASHEPISTFSRLRTPRSQ